MFWLNPPPKKFITEVTQKAKLFCICACYCIFGSCFHILVQGCPDPVHQGCNPSSMLSEQVGCAFTWPNNPKSPIEFTIIKSKEVAIVRLRKRKKAFQTTRFPKPIESGLNYLHTPKSILTCQTRLEHFKPRCHCFICFDITISVTGNNL